MRLGVLLPSSNTTMETELSKIFYQQKTDVTVHFARMGLVTVDPTALVEMKNELESEVKKLKDADIDFLIYGCTSGSLLNGKAYSDQIINEINRLLKKEDSSTTTSQCVLNSLEFLGVNKLIVFTPYIEEINHLEKCFLEDNGYHIVSIKGMKLGDNLEIGKISPAKLLNFIKSSIADIKKADGIFLSCTNLPTFKIIDFLEKKYQIPAISSNSSSLFEIVSRFPDICIKTDGLGRIFQKRQIK